MSPTVARPGSEPTPRELQVLRLVAIEGLGIREVAAALGIAPSTARHHLENVRRRAKAANVAQALWKFREHLAA